MPRRSGPSPLGLLGHLIPDYGEGLVCLHADTARVPIGGQTGCRVARAGNDHLRPYASGRTAGVAGDLSRRDGPCRVAAWPRHRHSVGDRRARVLLRSRALCAGVFWARGRSLIARSNVCFPGQAARGLSCLDVCIAMLLALSGRPRVHLRCRSCASSPSSPCRPCRRQASRDSARMISARRRSLRE